MPPHCDTRDGPVVKAARKALESNNVNYVLIWVPGDAEAELRKAFERTHEGEVRRKIRAGPCR